MKGPAEEEIGNDGEGRRRKGLDPGQEEGVVKVARGGDEGEELLLVRIGEEEGLEERGVRRKKRLKEREVGRGDQNGDVDAARNEAFGEVEEGNNVARRGERVGEDMDVVLRGGHVAEEEEKIGIG